MPSPLPDRLLAMQPKDSEQVQSMSRGSLLGQEAAVSVPGCRFLTAI